MLVGAAELAYVRVMQTIRLLLSTVLLAAWVGEVSIASPYATSSASQPSGEEFSSIEKDIIANVTLLFMLQ